MSERKQEEKKKGGVKLDSRASWFGTYETARPQAMQNRSEEPSGKRLAK